MELLANFVSKDEAKKINPIAGLFPKPYDAANPVKWLNAYIGNYWARRK
ncbi:MAG: hypothetical protein LBH19_15465 [Dysgonamonadaceae bacterium]|nr:hypothetical protein [Dysgonamonadaceae bacterium]